MGEQQITNFTCDLKFSLVDKNDGEISGGKALLNIEEDALTLQPETGKALSVPLRDIEEIHAADYRMQLELSSGEKLSLYHLGYRYEDGLRNLRRFRNEIILADMLAQEALRDRDVRGEFEYRDENDNLSAQGKCIIRLYESSLVILPEPGEITRFPIGCLDEVRQEDYRLLLSSDSGEKIVFSKLGDRLDFFKKNLSGIMNEISLKTQSFLKELLPEANLTDIRKLAGIMKDGKAAAKHDIAAISPGLWAGLEKQLLATPIGDEYEFLKSRGREDKIAVGCKKGLKGDLSGDSIWFLVPIYSDKPGTPGNAAAVEAAAVRRETTGEEDRETGQAEQADGGNAAAGNSRWRIEQEGRASYFFRIVSRAEYPHFKNIADLDKRLESFIKAFNRSMLTVNFRREPIYLPDEKLLEPAYRKYRFSLKRLPALGMLRSHFIGRVIHRSPEQWQKDVKNLLQFNVACGEDDKKWEKGG